MGIEQSALNLAAAMFEFAASVQKIAEQAEQHVSQMEADAEQLCTSAREISESVDEAVERTTKETPAPAKPAPKAAKSDDTLQKELLLGYLTQIQNQHRSSAPVKELLGSFGAKSMSTLKVKDYPAAIDAALKLLEENAA